MAALCRARVMIGTVPFARWRNSLGGDVESGSEESLPEGQRLARHVENAARRLPFATQCLPRAMALSWLLRKKKIAHFLVFAVRPSEIRTSADALHAWVEVGGTKVIGDVPGPWIEMLRLGGSANGTGAVPGR